MHVAILYHFMISVFDLNGSRGIAILVTCDYGNDSTLKLPATSIKRDADSMKETFQKLGYDIHEAHNKSKDEIKTLLEDLYKYLKQYKGTPINQDGSEKVIAFAFSGHGLPDDMSFIDKNSMTLITYDRGHLSLKGDVMSHIGVNSVYQIPKLFFIDACRGIMELRYKSSTAKAAIEVEGNYRIEFATVPDHKAYATSGEGSKWMPEMARHLRDMKNESLQNIAATVRKTINDQNRRDNDDLQLCESRDRLATGPLYLYPVHQRS